jgi:acyl carrier protein
MAPFVSKDSVEAVFRQVLGPEYNSDQSQLRLQSLRMLELVVAIENEFSVSIPEDAPIAKITASVQNVVDYLNQMERRR